MAADGKATSKPYKVRVRVREKRLSRKEASWRAAYFGDRSLYKLHKRDCQTRIQTLNQTKGQTQSQQDINHLDELISFYQKCAHLELQQRLDLVNHWLDSIPGFKKWAQQQWNRWTYGTRPMEASINNEGRPGVLREDEPYLNEGGVYEGEESNDEFYLKYDHGAPWALDEYEDDEEEPQYKFIELSRDVEGPKKVTGRGSRKVNPPKPVVKQTRNRKTTTAKVSDGLSAAKKNKKAEDTVVARLQELSNGRIHASDLNPEQAGVSLAHPSFIGGEGLPDDTFLEASTEPVNADENNERQELSTERAKDSPPDQLEDDNAGAKIISKDSRSEYLEPSSRPMKRNHSSQTGEQAQKRRKSSKTKHNVLKKKYKTLQAEHAELEESKKALRKSKRSTDKENRRKISELRSMLESVQKELSAPKGETPGLYKARDALESTSESARYEERGDATVLRDRLREQKDKLTSEQTSGDKLKAAYEAQKQAFEETMSKSCSEIAILKHQVRETESELAAATERKKGLNVQLDSTRADLAAEKGHNFYRQNRMNALRDELAAQTRQNIDLRNQLDEEQKGNRRLASCVEHQSHSEIASMNASSRGLNIREPEAMQALLELSGLPSAVEVKDAAST